MTICEWLLLQPGFNSRIRKSSGPTPFSGDIFPPRTYTADATPIFDAQDVHGLSTHKPEGRAERRSK
jgi:hypothetical protein